MKMNFTWFGSHFTWFSSSVRRLRFEGHVQETSTANKGKDQKERYMFWPTSWTHADVRDKLRATYTVPSLLWLPRVFQYPWERVRCWCITLLNIILSFATEKEFLVKTSAAPRELFLRLVSLKSFWLLIKLRRWKLPTATDHLNYPHCHYQIGKQSQLLLLQGNT